VSTAFLHAFGAHLPDCVVTNEELAARLGRTADWIENASGIRERRWAASESSVADLAVLAAQDCLQRAGIEASALGLVMLASGSAPPGFPGPAAAVIAGLGLEGTPAFDVPMASAGTLFGLALASQLTERFGDVLVIGAEKMSAILSAGPLDPNTAILFGDGAGAALVSSRAGRWRILDAVLHSDGQFRDDLAFDWASPLRMNGLSVIMQASRKLPSAIEEVLARQGITAQDVTTFVLHQANQNLLVRVARALKVSPERVFSNVARYGNTSSASMLIAAAEWSQENPVPGPVIFSAFGAGFHWGALLAQGV